MKKIWTSSETETRIPEVIHILGYVFLRGSESLIVRNTLFTYKNLDSETINVVIRNHSKYTRN